MDAVNYYNSSPCVQAPWVTDALPVESTTQGLPPVVARVTTTCLDYFEIPVFSSLALADHAVPPSAAVNDSATSQFSGQTSVEEAMHPNPRNQTPVNVKSTAIGSSTKKASDAASAFLTFANSDALRFQTTQRFLDYSEEDVETRAQIEAIIKSPFCSPSKLALQIIDTCAIHFKVSVSNLLTAQHGNSLAARAVAAYLFDAHLKSISFMSASDVGPEDNFKAPISSLQADIEAVEQLLNLPSKFATGKKQKLPPSSSSSLSETVGERGRLTEEENRFHWQEKKFDWVENKFKQPKRRKVRPTQELKSAPTGDKAIQIANRIIDACASRFKVKASDIKEGKRKDIIFPRKVVLYLCSQHLNLSYPEIASVFSMQTSTVNIAYTTFVDKLLNTAREHIEALEEELDLPRTKFS